MNPAPEPLPPDDGGDPHAPELERVEHLLDLGRGEQAQDAASRILRVDPQHPAALLAFARGGLLRGDPRAYDAARAALAVAPEDVDALCVAALAAAVRRRGWEARELIGAAVARSPHDADVHTTHAQVALLGIVTKAAMASAREAVRLRPWDADAHRLLGALLIERGRTTEARAALGEALRLDPANEPARDDLARADAAGGHPIRASAWFAEQLGRAPDDPRAAHNVVAAASRLAGIVHTVLLVAALPVWWIDSVVAGRVLAAVATGVGVGAAGRVYRGVVANLPPHRRRFVRFALRRSPTLTLFYVLVAAGLVSAWAWSLTPTALLGDAAGQLMRRLFLALVLAAFAVRIARRVTGRNRFRPVI
ncbi:tetratricopeptide repeat protein [Jatrophihabitans fulvus]